MESTRQQKVGRLLQKELGTYFQQHQRDLVAGKMITVTQVRISPDLGVAKAYLSIFPSENSGEALEIIRSHNAAVRNYIGRKVKNQLRIVPEFVYYLDDSLDYIENIDNLLKEDE